MVWIPVAIAGAAVVIGINDRSVSEVAYLGAALVLIVAAMTVRRNLKGRAPMTLTETGIELADGGVVPWGNLDDLGEAYVRGALGYGKGLGIRLKNRKQFENSLGGRPIDLKSRDFSGGWDLTWPTSALPGTPHEAETTIREYWGRVKERRGKK